MLTLHSAPLLLPPGAEPLPDGAVLVQGEAVLAVGPRADLAAAHPGARTRAWPGLLTTGLTHARAVPLLEAAYHPDPREYDQLGDASLTGDALARLAPDRTRRSGSARRGVQRLLRHGVTRVAGTFTDPAVCSALARSGVLAVPGPGPGPGRARCPSTPSRAATTPSPASHSSPASGPTSPPSTCPTPPPCGTGSRRLRGDRAGRAAGAPGPLSGAGRAGGGPAPGRGAAGGTMAG